MGKSLAEITAALEVEYTGPTYEKNGHTYIPWNEAMKAANEVFGIDGYDVQVIDSGLEAVPNDAGEVTYVYTATTRVTVFPTDGRPFYRDGVGCNELEFTKVRTGYRSDGTQYALPSRAQIDTAKKGAASDSTNRAFKLFGKRFGLNLYDKGDSPESGTAPTPNNNTATQPRPVQSSGGSDRGPSEGQLRFAASLGYTAEEFAAMPWQERKGILDNKVRKPVAKATARVASAPVAESLASMAAAMLDEDAA